MLSSHKSIARRTAIRENRPDNYDQWWCGLRESGALHSLLIASTFWVVALGILSLRENVVPYRPGQAVPYDVMSRVDFSYQDKGLLAQKQIEARDNTPRVYRAQGDPWQGLSDTLLSLPDEVAGVTFDQLAPRWKAVLDSGSLTALQQYSTHPLRERYAETVNGYIRRLRDQSWVMLAANERDHELPSRRWVTLEPASKTKELDATFPVPANDDLKLRIDRIVVDSFRLELQPKVLALTLNMLQPNYRLDADATAEAANNAADSVPAGDGEIHFRRNQPLVHKGTIEPRDWQLLRAENQAFVATLGEGQWRSLLGLAGVAALLTAALSAYTAHFQPRVVKNHTRAIAIAGLLLSMLLVAQLAGLYSGPIFLLGIAPTLMVGIILSIAYEPRFAVGAASVHALLVTIGLDQRVGFLLIIWIGTLTACFLLSDIRSRSKLIEVGGISALAMMAAAAAWGMISFDPWAYLLNNALYAGAAGLTVGFIVLGILPFIEKMFRITTSMTLLEMADASHPLLRRLAVEAPGTYNHSLQVATLAEAAAEAIGANSLLCRVAAYYHDVGKINKADYFVENQLPGQQNRHLNLTPSVSLLIIIGHVKDGIELAREYALPNALVPFIQQHHGTTLVEYFYHAAKTKQGQNKGEPEVPETQYRYPGPKPRTKEAAIVMIADCVESATRAMGEPTAPRIETLVHDLTMRRLLDGQFDDCELTMRDIERVESALVKMLLSIYHGRIAYPSNERKTPVQPGGAIKLA